MPWLLQPQLTSVRFVDGEAARGHIRCFILGTTAGALLACRDSRQQLDACLRDWATWHSQKYLPVSKATLSYKARHAVQCNTNG
jgi:hypothetical protein